MNNLEDDISAKYIDEITANPSEDGLSRNTGFVTFSHQGTIVPEIVSKLSFLHEIGHSLGSPVSKISPPPIHDMYQSQMDFFDLLRYDNLIEA